jgi:hypothetical protein
MAIPNDDKHAVPDQESRNMQREMAAEWLKLAGSVRSRPRSTQMQME